MHLQPLFILPAEARRPVFDGSHYNSARFTFACGKCRSNCEVKLISFVDAADEWFKGQSEDDRGAIVRHFGCRWKQFDGRSYASSHDEGFPYFGPYACSSCGATNMLYVSFFEKQPGRYVAALQGAAIAGA